MLAVAGDIHGAAALILLLIGIGGIGLALYLAWVGRYAAAVVALVVGIVAIYLS